MSRASPIITSVNAGEFSPAMEGRSDLAKYPQACKLIENFQLLVQGPAQRRGGSRYVKPIKNESTGAWLVRFEYSATQAFVLEFGHLYVRVFANHGQVLTTGTAAYNAGTAYAIGDLAASGGIVYYCIAATTGNAPPNATYWYPLTADIYELPSPYSFSDMANEDGSCRLQFVQSGDVVYIAHQSRTYKPYKLTRLGNTQWIFSVYQPNLGPFLPENETSTTISASATTGAITLTASSAVFAPTDVGRLVRIQSANLEEPWNQDDPRNAGDINRYDQKVYQALNSNTTKLSPPIHEQGDCTDGQGGVNWRYIHPGYGIARITAYTSATQVSASVVVDEINGLKQLPTQVTTTATKRWKLGAWSDTTGYPAAVTFYKNRLHWGGGLAWWATVPNDFENMSADFFGQITADCAITEQVNSQNVNAVLWMEGLDKLVIGTGGGEFVIGAQTNTGAYGPGNISSDKQSQRRSRAVPPVVVGTALCYVQRAGRKLLSLNYVIDRDRFVSTDLAVLADRITRSGIVAMAYQGEPHSIVWCVLGNGKLLGFTYNQEQEVTGWHRHPIGGNGFVESIATIPAPDGDREELWLIVRRTINGVTRRYVEFFEKPWEGVDQDGTAGDDQADAFYVDAGVTYEGAATTTLTGFDHLEGETIQLLVNGAVHPERTVSGGAVSLQRAATKAQGGKQAIARLVPLKIEAGANDGTAQGKLQRAVQIAVRFVDTLGGLVGMYGSPLDDISVRNPSTPMDQPPVIGSGIFVTDFPSDWDRNGLIEIRQEQPLPMTVSAIMPVIYTSPT